MVKVPLDPEVQAFALFIKLWRGLDDAARADVVAGRAAICWASVPVDNIVPTAPVTGRPPKEVILRLFRWRILEAIGGRAGALAFEKKTGGRFRRTTVQSWIDGKTHPDFAELLAFAEETERDISFFTSNLGDSDDEGRK